MTKSGDGSSSEIGTRSGSSNSSIVLNNTRSLRRHLGNSRIRNEGQVTFIVWQDTNIAADDILVLVYIVSCIASMKKNTIRIPLGFSRVVLLVIEPGHSDLNHEKRIDIHEHILTIDRKAHLAGATID